MDTNVLLDSEHSDSESRLAQLGLKAEHLLVPARRGLSAFASCTSNHPPVFGGFWAWAETVCALREELTSLGWKRVNESNLPLVVNEDRTIAISVATGDEDTGRADGSPCTSSAKGPRTARVVLENLGQMVLIPVEQLPPENIITQRGRSTWILLMYRDLAARELRCELSRPAHMSEDGHVIGWTDRIILKPTLFDADMLLFEKDDNYKTSEIDIDIRKRA